MAVFLLRMLFWCIGTAASMASLILLKTTAVLVVVFIHMFKIPGMALNGLLDQAAALLRSGVEYMIGLLLNAVWSLISGGFDLITGTATGSVALTSSAMIELMDNTRTALDDLAEIFPEVFSGTSEMVGSFIVNLWSYYKDAVGYVMENA
ncbi:hypothetical protein J5N97_019838 [Dioscorea zingiberensis]|uniref:Uncharacterized protein n=1 Tax=Dioscorea zingiberensis TaxID=325984 RepID=A0A9D5CFG1_9LILI|nr:hypothetical protein J5N97_019838 [Dioscorea zingiberensis]